MALHGPVDEVGDDVAVLAGHFARAVGIEKPRLDHGQPVVVPVEVAVELARHLGDLVGRRQVHRHELFFQRQRSLRAVDGTTRPGVDEPLEVALQHCVLKHLDGAERADQQILLRVVNRVLIGEEGCEMKDVVGFFVENALQIDLVGDAALDEQHVRQIGDAPLVGGRQVVEDDDFGCTGLREGARQIAADRSCPACDENGFVFVGKRHGHLDTSHGLDGQTPIVTGMGRAGGLLASVGALPGRGAPTKPGP